MPMPRAHIDLLANKYNRYLRAYNTETAMEITLRQHYFNAIANRVDLEDRIRKRASGEDKFETVPADPAGDPAAEPAGDPAPADPAT